MYFITNWMPRISPNGLRILLALRSLGYYNPKGGSARGEIDVEQPELATLSGVKLRTLQRTFADDEVLGKYVRRVFHVKRDGNGRILREHYVYVVTMDDILTPEDESRLAEMLEGPDKNLEEPEKNQDSSTDLPADAPSRQNGGSYNKEIHTLHTLNTSDTPAARPEFFASLSELEQPWLDQAETELQENFGLGAWQKTTEKSRTALRRQRATTLYEKSSV